MLIRAALTVAAMGAVLLGTTALVPLIDGVEWWPATAAVVVAVGVAGIGLRALRVTVVLLPLLQTGAAVCALTVLFAPSHALGGVVPTPDAIAALLDLFAQGRVEIGRYPTPIAPTPSLSLVVAVCVGLLALVSDFFAVTARTPALVGMPLMCLVLVPLTVDDNGVAWPAFAATAVGYLLVLTVDGWARHAGWSPRSAAGAPAPVRVSAALGAARHALASAGVAAVAIALALLVPLAVPGLSTSALHGMAEQVSVGGSTVRTTHPLVSLRRDLTSASNRTVLEYRTTAEDPGYLRMYVLDVFDGENWTMSPMRASGRNAVGDGALPEPPGLRNMSAEPVTTEVTMGEDTAPVEFLPLPYPAREIEVAGDWYADPESLMVFSTQQRRSGLRYEVRSLRPNPSPATLEDSRGAQLGVDDRFLDAPDDLDPRVAELTAAITADATTPHERAVALQDWFTTDDRFRYDLRPPRVPRGRDPLPYFLTESRIGYCEQFAGAMAIMARQAGIPARVAVGYTSGTQQARGAGDGRWEVAESDAHAWPELYFEGQGWLRFEPTPSASDGQGTASVPEYAAPAGEEEPASSPSPSAPDESGEPSPEVSASPSEQPTQDAESPAAPEDAADDAAPSGSSLPVAWRYVLGGAAVLGLLFAPMAGRVAVRRVRWAGAATPVARARVAWRELCDDAADLGLVWSPAQSPRAVARRVGERLGPEARAALWRVALAEESARYAPHPEAPESLAQDVRTVRAALRAGAGRAARTRAVLLPRSLLRLPRPAPRDTARPDPA